MSIFLKLAPLTPSQLAEKRKWFEARDTFLGLGTSIDFAKGLKLAKTSAEEDAKWLCSVFPEPPPVDIDQVVTVFLDIASNAKPSIKALCFSYAGYLNGNEELVAKAAILGDPFAHAQMANEDGQCVENSEIFCCAEYSALRYDSRGMAILANLYKKGVGCTKNKAKSQYFWRFAASLGSARAAEDYGRFLHSKAEKEGVENVEAYSLLEQAWKFDRYYDHFEQASKGFMREVRRSYHSQLGQNILDSEIISAILFSIGETVCIQPLVYNKNITPTYKYKEKYEKHFNRVMFTTLLYKEWCHAARLAVNAWSVCAKRFKIYKDIRIMIGKMVWDAKKDASYVLSNSTLDAFRNLL